MDRLNEYLQELRTQQNLSPKTLQAYKSDIAQFSVYMIAISLL